MGACSFPDYRFLPEDHEPVRDPFAVCTDGMPSDAETGIDCGGGCPPCGMGQTDDHAVDCGARGVGVSAHSLSATHGDACAAIDHACSAGTSIT